MKIELGILEIGAYVIIGSCIIRYLGKELMNKTAENKRLKEENTKLIIESFRRRQMADETI